MRVLLVEDDALLSAGIEAGLTLSGVTVDSVATLALADAALRSATFDAIVLDLGLPDGDGVDLVLRMRARENGTPVLVLSARDAVRHRITALHAGADDYMVKPFDLGELAARLHALSRRTAGLASDLVRHGALSFSLSQGTAWLDGAPVELSRREIALLSALLRHPGAILSATQLAAYLYGFNETVESNALNVHIHHIRRRLGPRVIETIRGVGYRLGEAGHG